MRETKKGSLKWETIRPLQCDCISCNIIIVICICMVRPGTSVSIHMHQPCAVCAPCKWIKQKKRNKKKKTRKNEIDDDDDAEQMTMMMMMPDEEFNPDFQNGKYFLHFLLLRCSLLCIYLYGYFAS